MGTFFVRCKIENVADRERSAVLTKVVVDTVANTPGFRRRLLRRSA